MARGWESKSVESQIEDRRATPERRPIATAADHKRDSLEMSRRRILRDMENARGETHRTALQNALSWLDNELRKLES